MSMVSSIRLRREWTLGRSGGTAAAAHDVPEPGRRPTHPGDRPPSAYGGLGSEIARTALRIQGFDADSRCRQQLNQP